MGVVALWRAQGGLPISRLKTDCPQVKAAFLIGSFFQFPCDEL